MIGIVNLLTGSRIILSISVYYMILHNRPAALILAFCAIIGLSDWLDGKLARKFNAETRAGAVLDVLADLTFMILAYSALAIRGFIPASLLVVVLYKFAEFCTTSFIASRGRFGKRVFVSDPVGRLASLLFYILPSAVMVIQLVLPFWFGAFVLLYLCVLIPLVLISSVNRICFVI